MPVSSKHTGWRFDRANSRLDYYYQGTRVGHIDASGLSTAGSEIVNSVVQTAGLAANSVTPAKLGANMAIGFRELPLGSWRLITSNDFPAIAVASKNGGNLAVDTDPKLIRVNAATDKLPRIQWAATSVIEIQNQFVYPPDLDDTATVTFNFLANMGGTNDIPVVAVSYFEAIGDTNAGGNSAAVTGVTMAQYSVVIAAADVAAYPKPAAITLIPASHGTDTLNIYGTWLTYTKKA